MGIKFGNNETWYPKYSHTYKGYGIAGRQMPDGTWLLRVHKNGKIVNTFTSKSKDDAFHSAIKYIDEQVEYS